MWILSSKQKENHQRNSAFIILISAYIQIDLEFSKYKNRNSVMK